MRVLLFAEYLFPQSWRPEAWGAQIGRALHARGHDVTLACDGGRDLLGLAPLRVLAFRPLRTWRSGAPVGFARWARRVRRTVAHDASLSFTPLAAADATLSLGGAGTILRAIAGASNPFSGALELLHQPWLPAAAAVEAVLAHSSPGVRLRFGLPRDGDRAAAIGYASRLPWAGDAASAFQSQTRRGGPPAARARGALVRDLFGIAERRPVILLSSAHVNRPGLEPMLRALAEVRAESRPALAPVVVAAGRSAYTLQALAARAGCRDALRIAGGTEHMADLLDAADVVAAPGSARGQGTGRMIADALRRGVPVLADRGAPGAELLAPSAENRYTAPGLVVERRTAGAWREALARGLDEAWRDEAAGAALEMGWGLSMDALAARLEGVLERARARVSPT